MNREDIIRMAVSNGFFQNDEGTITSPFIEDVCILELLTDFADDVAAAEREACAKLCDKEIEEWGWDADVVDVGMSIRARGQQC